MASLVAPGGDGQLSSPPAQPSQAAPEDTAPAAVPRGAWLMHAKRDGLWPAPPALQPPAQQPAQPAAPQLLRVSIELPRNHSNGGSGVPSPGACRGNSPRRIGASEVSHKRLVLLGSGALSSPRSNSGASKSTRGDELASARTMSARSLEAKLARTFAVARILDSKSCNRGVRKRSLKGEGRLRGQCATCYMMPTIVHLSVWSQHVYVLLWLVASKQVCIRHLFCASTTSRCLCVWLSVWIVYCHVCCRAESAACTQQT